MREVQKTLALGFIGALSWGFLCWPSALAQTPSDGEAIELRPQITESGLEKEINLFDPRSTRVLKPELKGLITIEKSLNPFNLDSNEPVPVSLKDILNTALNNNLEIGIAGADLSTGKWRYRQALSGYLPSASLAFNYNYLNGSLNLPFGTPDPIRFNNPFIFTSAGVNYGLYRGGRTVFGALKARNQYRANAHKRDATINDVLTSAYQMYHQLILSESILRIRIQAVRVSDENLKLAKARFDAGSATRLDVMQAQTQLSTDRQNLIDQQIDRRQAAIALAEFLNVNQAQDFLPEDNLLTKRDIVNPQGKVERMLVKALTERPELKQKEEERLAARKEIVVKAAPLQPEVNFSNSVYGVGETLSNSHKTITTQGLNGPVDRRVSKQIKPLLVVGLSVNWKLDGMGMKDLSAVQQARYQARRAALAQTQEVNRVVKEVRSAYLNVLRTDRQIEEALSRLESSQEEIKLARLRYESGLGKNIDVLRAQSDYTRALIRKAEAIVNYNIAQAQLLRDIGLTNVGNLTSLKAINL